MNITAKARCRSIASLRAIALAVSLTSTLAGAQALTAKPDALLSIDLNREAIVEKVTTTWARELPAQQIASLAAKLMALRADQLLAAHLAGSVEGMLEVLNDAEQTQLLATFAARSSITADLAQRHGVRHAQDLAHLTTQVRAQSPATAQFAALNSSEDKSKAVGDPTIDLVYTPIAPCNLMDTRSGVSPAPPEGGPALNAGYGIRVVQITGRCGIPAGAKAVASLFTVENIPSTGGVVFAGDAGGAGGAIASWSTPANYASGSSLVPLSATGAMQLQSAGATQIKIDVNGYFMPPNRNGDGLRVIRNPGSAPTIVNGASNNSANQAGATISGGYSNSVTAATSTISGGGGNSIVTGFASTIGGGQSNSISGGNENTIAGGIQNAITAGFQSSIAGGWNNTVSASYGFIGAGSKNTVAGYAGSIVGGGGGKILGGNSNFMGSGGINDQTNCYDDTLGTNTATCWNEIAATAGSSVLLGGYNNRVTANTGFVGAGSDNRVEKSAGAIVAGSGNRITNANAFASFIGAGNNNSVAADKSAIVGGRYNTITDTADSGAFIGAGRGNTVTGMRAAIVGGGSDAVNCWNSVTGLFDVACGNRAQGKRNLIGAGIANRTSGTDSAVLGGQSNEATGDYSVVAGGSTNVASGVRSFIGGGGSFSINSCLNRATGSFDGPCQNVASGAISFVGSGYGNVASGSNSAIVAGFSNLASGPTSFIGGGFSNTASGDRSVIAGGSANTASSSRATVGGGAGNTAGAYAVVPGGWSNSATGAFSFAGGRAAATNDGATTPTDHYGAFVWADAPDGTPSTTLQFFRSTANNQFAVRARGGVSFKVDATTIAANATDATAGCSLPSGGAASWSCSSDRNLKDGIKAISPKDVLSKVVNLPLSTWQFKGTSRRHLSPMAQDFWAAFGFGEDDRHITASDVSGVALAAVQGINQKLNSEVLTLKSKNSQLERTNATMQRELAAIKKKLGM